ncbi:hypothetical protein TWF694_007014 [Orbilia ellipsospora]|uniref:Uncharacterized protein n=1 Tax=Orbilia ellipsospora TaxID=2528407 RepID=A0AAV9XMA2_9PEZI
MTAQPSNHERNPPATSTSTRQKKKSKRQKQDGDDDTPKAFKRLMAYAATGKRPNGLDDPRPSSSSKKRKRSDIPSTTVTDDNTQPPNETENTSVKQPKQDLTLLPGEKLSDFSRRVDAAIPISFKGLQRSDPDHPTKKKKKKPTTTEPTEEEITEDSYDFDDNGDPLPNHLKPHSHNKPNTSTDRNSRKGRGGGRDKRSPSPFSILREKRGAVQSSINDVVQAPPSSLVVPKEKLKDKTKLNTSGSGGQGGGLNLGVPKSSGSLARREMLEVERKGVVERYRALMAARSGGL